MLFIWLLMIAVICCGVDADPAGAGDDDNQLENLSDLIQYLNANPRSRIGFLTRSNYESVKKSLPNSIVPVYVDSKAQLLDSVINGSIVASLTSSMPDYQSYHAKLHTFSSNVVSMHTIFMSPDYSSENMHGNQNDFLSTYDLSRAINAAIAQIQFDGIDLQIAQKYGPKQLVQAYTCKNENASNFNLANKKDATGLLRVVLDEKRLRVLADGPYDWGQNDGNYLLDTPVGFYPEYLNKLVEVLGKLSGPDGVPYGKLRVERVFASSLNASNAYFPWHLLFTGQFHITEPYFLLDSTYSGSNKPCQSTNDCFRITKSEREMCDEESKVCRLMTARPRISMLRASCTTLGSDSVFSTRKQTKTTTTTTTRTSMMSIEEENKKESKTSQVTLTLTIVFGILSVLLCVALVFSLVKLRQRQRYMK